MAGQFKNLVKGAKKGAAKGCKMKKNKWVQATSNNKHIMIDNERWTVRTIIIPYWIYWLKSAHEYSDTF